MGGQERSFWRSGIEILKQHSRPSRKSSKTALHSRRGERGGRNERKVFARCSNTWVGMGGGGRDCSHCSAAKRIRKTNNFVMPSAAGTKSEKCHFPWVCPKMLFWNAGSLAAREKDNAFLSLFLKGGNASCSLPKKHKNKHFLARTKKVLLRNFPRSALYNSSKRG